MSILSQRSLAGGELAPALYARTDIQKYQIGLRTLRNFFVKKHGGASNRAGTQFIGEVNDSTKTVRLIPFEFNSEQTYILEFGDEYIRVIHDGEYVSDLELTITGITNANPAVVTYTGTDPANGDEVALAGIVGAIGAFLNGRNFKVVGLNAGANTFQLDYMDGTNVDSTTFGSYGSAGTASRIYTIDTTYEEAELDDIRFTQSADVVTIVHPSHAPAELIRNDHDDWELADIEFGPTLAGPAGSVTAGGAGALTFRYVITSVEAETYIESLPGVEATKSVTAVTNASPAVITTGSNHGYATGDIVYFPTFKGIALNMGGVIADAMTDDQPFTITVLSATTFSIPVNSSADGAFVANGDTCRRSYVIVHSAAAPSSSAPHVISWTAVAGAAEYNIYKELNGIFGFIGVAAGLDSASTITFRDTNISADTTETPPNDLDYFAAASDYPSTLAYFQQRLLFANTNNDPEKVFASRISAFKNFTSRSPIQDDDALSFIMAGQQVNQVKHLVDVGSLLIFTTAGEWVARGDSSGILRPGEVNPKQQSYHGSADIQPLVIGGSALFVQDGGNIIRDFDFNFQVDKYAGNDLTVFSSHLFENYQIVDWAFQKTPDSILWVVRDDGALLGLTYVKEHQVWAWHKHDFSGGTVENVAVIKDGSEHVLYVVVKRTIDGGTKRYVEKLSSRAIDDIRDVKIMDSFLSYDGRNTGARTMTMTEFAGGGWTDASTITVTASSSFFASTDVGNEIQINGLDDDGEEVQVRVEITSYVSATVVRGQPNRTVPTGMRSAATTDWALAVDEISGLWHLEGETVSVIGDGYVAASPNNDDYDAIVVEDGAITLDQPYGVIHVGLPITADIEPLDIDTVDGETLSDKHKLVNAVTLHIEKSRGIWAGPKPPTDDDDDPLENMDEAKARGSEGYDEPISLTTEKVDITIRSEWNSNGRVFIRQVDPLPVTVLAISPAGSFPFRGG